MDLMKLLRSLEEFLYELVGWLVFYPRTLWRIVRHPGAIARYTRLELTHPEDAQFTDTISPVLMLILSVVLAHALEMALRIPLPQGGSQMARDVLGSEQVLLLTRSVVFCVYALGAALGMLKRSRQPVTRATLREPFSVQAFLICPFIVFMSLGLQLATLPDHPLTFSGAVMAIAAGLWYVAARTIAFRALYGGGWLPPLLAVCARFILTTVIIVGVIWLAIA